MRQRRKTWTHEEDYLLKSMWSTGASNQSLACSLPKHPLYGILAHANVLRLGRRPTFGRVSLHAVPRPISTDNVSSAAEIRAMLDPRGDPNDPRHASVDHVSIPYGDPLLARLRKYHPEYDPCC